VKHCEAACATRGEVEHQQLRRQFGELADDGPGGAGEDMDVEAGALHDRDDGQASRDVIEHHTKTGEWPRHTGNLPTAPEGKLRTTPVSA